MLRAGHRRADRHRARPAVRHQPPLYLAYSKSRPGRRPTADAADQLGAGGDARQVGRRLPADRGRGHLRRRRRGTALRRSPTRCCGQGPAYGSYGGRMAIDKDGYLYVTSGDRNYGELVAGHGQPHRQSPADQPRRQRAARQPVHLGCRACSRRSGRPATAIQTGLTIDPATGTLWETEFGPRGGDELNRIERGQELRLARRHARLPLQRRAAGEGRARRRRHDRSGLGVRPAVGQPRQCRGLPRRRCSRPGEGNLLIAMMNRTLVRMELAPDGHVVAQEAHARRPSASACATCASRPTASVYVLTDETAGAILKITPAP